MENPDFDRVELIRKEVGEAAALLYWNRLPIVIEAKKQDARIARLQNLVWAHVPPYTPTMAK